MPTSFHEVALDDAYSAIAGGGPEWSTAVIKSGEGGSVASRAIAREDYQSRYEISYEELSFARQQDLRKFGILRRGMAIGFRFLAPDDHELVDERAGWLNPATAEVEWLQKTPASNTLDEFYLIKHYSDIASAYTRRIIKPSPWHDLSWTLWDFNGGGTPIELGSDTILAESTLIGGVVDPISDHTVFMSGGVNYQIDWVQGKIIWSDGPAPDDSYFTISCTYHIPAVFSEDWHKFDVDEVAISKFRIGIEEILPVELGIT